MRDRRESRAHPGLYSFSFVFPLFFFSFAAKNRVLFLLILPFVFPSVLGSPTMTGQAFLGQDTDIYIYIYIEKSTAAMGLRPACSRIKIQDYTQANTRCL